MEQHTVSSPRNILEPLPINPRNVLEPHPISPRNTTEHPVSPRKRKEKVKKTKKSVQNKYAFDPFSTADGPIPVDQEKEFSDEVLPRLVYSNLDKAQTEMIKKFREDPEIAKWIYEPSDSYYFHTDFYLARFLVAREWDFAKSKQMFIDAMKWRKENNVDTIIEDFEKNPFYEILSKYWPGSASRAWDFWSYDNSFITYSSLGSIDTSVVKYVPQDILIKFHIYTAELLERKYNKVVKQKGYFPGCIIVEDLADLGMGFLDKRVLDLIKEAIRIDSDYYPAILRKFYLTNTPKVFTMVWGIVKTFFDKGTLEKFEIVSETKKIIPTLQVIIPPKYLPAHLEGACLWKMPDASQIKVLVKKMKADQNKE